VSPQYLVGTPYMREADFSAAIIRKLAERAAYICSNPGCNRITVGPSKADPNKSAKTGVAAHICSAQPMVHVTTCRRRQRNARASRMEFGYVVHARD
jgi:hypothetical protein